MLRLGFTLFFFSFGVFAKDKIVGIVLDRNDASIQNPSVYGKYGFYSNKSHYADAIHELCKGVSVIFIPPVIQNIDVYADIIDGLLLPGLTPDIDPKYYNEKPIASGDLDKYRTEFEIKMINLFYKTRKPVLGICHGMQAINVAFGGSLYQDIPTQLESNINHNPFEDGALFAHEVIVDNTYNVFSDLVGSNKTIMVNSVHHQGVKGLGQGLTAVAVSIDGLTEAIQMKSHPFLVGVQWHPEFRISKTDRRLIQEFCRAVKQETPQRVEASIVEQNDEVKPASESGKKRKSS